MKPHYPFIASKNYKGGTTSGCVSDVAQAETDTQPELIPDPLSKCGVKSLFKYNGSGISNY